MAQKISIEELDTEIIECMSKYEEINIPDKNMPVIRALFIFIKEFNNSNNLRSVVTRTTTNAPPKPKGEPSNRDESIRMAKTTSSIAKKIKYYCYDDINELVNVIENSNIDAKIKETIDKYFKTKENLPAIDCISQTAEHIGSLGKGAGAEAGKPAIAAIRKYINGECSNYLKSAKPSRK